MDRKTALLTTSVSIALLTSTMLATIPVVAESEGYTDFSQFAAAADALNGPGDVLNFDSLSDGTIIPSGATVDGLLPIYDFGGVQLEVRAVSDPAAFDTSSSPNFLASEDAGVLQDGDNIDFVTDGFINAFGLRITIADEMFVDDIVLSANGLDVSLDPADVQGVLADGSTVYFVGIVDPEIGFSTVQLRTAGDGFFLYSLDDVFASSAPDSDADGVADVADNCLLISNATQLDTDGDSIGNACDADIGQPNDCIVNFIDLSVIRVAFLSVPGLPNWNPDADFNGDSIVNFQDFSIIRDMFFLAPGPSGLPNGCAAAQFATSIEGKNNE